MSDMKAYQRTDLCSDDGETVEESKLLWEITNFKIIQEELASKKIQLSFIDAEWWITVGKPTLDKNYMYVMDFKVHISRSPNQCVDLKNIKFAHTAIITQPGNTLFREVASNPGWNEMTNNEFLYTSKSEFSNTAVLSINHILIDTNLKIKIFRGSVIKSNFFNPMKDNSSVIDILSKMLEESSFSDFKFIVKGKEFKVHKNLLAASSPVFARLFTSNMQEANDNVCIVEKIEPEIFENLLQFIYRGNLPENFSEIAQDLYEAAHYYDLTRLKEFCAKMILSKLSKENAFDLYCWAYTYDSLQELKDDSWEIIKREVLHICFRIKGEPLSPKDLRELIEHKKSEQDYWEKLKE